MARSAPQKPKSEYEHVEPNEWTSCAKVFDLACCDCSLVHRVRWRILTLNGREELQLKFNRNGPATGGMRSRLRASRKHK